MEGDIMLPGGGFIPRDQLSPCRCPGCSHCGKGCHSRIFHVRTWKDRPDSGSEWREHRRVVCCVCLPARPSAAGRDGKPIRTEEITVATIDMATGRITPSADRGKIQ